MGVRPTADHQPDMGVASQGLQDLPDDALRLCGFIQRIHDNHETMVQVCQGLDEQARAVRLYPSGAGNLLDEIRDSLLSRVDRSGDDPQRGERIGTYLI